MGLKLIRFILLFLFQIHLICFSNNPVFIGSRQAGMANATVTLTDVWAINHNQAGLANLQNTTLSIYHENKFNISNLGTKAFVIAIPNKTATVGASFSSFGNSNYNKNRASLAIGKKLGKRFSSGIQINYLNTYIGEHHGNANNVSFEGGFIFEPTQNMTIGAHIFNPVKSRIKNGFSEKIPCIMRLGIGLNFGEEVLICSETEKILDQKPVFKIGIEYCYKNKLFLRTGILTNPILNSFGIGYSLKWLSTDISCTRHQILGYSTQFTLSYVIKK